MGRIRNNDFIPFEVPLCAVIRLNHCNTGELALRAGHWCQRNALHAGHFLEHFLQLMHALQETLTVTRRAQRVPARKPRQ